MDSLKSSKSTHQRLFEQHTVNSLARRVNKSESVDSLDLSLSAVYNHETDLFHSKHRTVLQMVNSANNPIRQRLYDELKERQRKSLHHPLIIGEQKKTLIYSLKMQISVCKIPIKRCCISGGITDRKSPHSVKLICIGHHTPITNPGYSRQPIDGNIFNY